LAPEPAGELTVLPNPPNWFKGALLLRRGERKVKEGKGRKREGKGRGVKESRNTYPPSIPAYAPDPFS